MTSYTQSEEIPLTAAQLAQIEVYGGQAIASIEAAAAAPDPYAPVSAWVNMYNYINQEAAQGLLTAPAGESQADWQDQLYWFSQAPYINGENLKVPSGYFVNDVTALGMSLGSDPTAPQVQSASDAVGYSIYRAIVGSVSGQYPNGALPAFWSQLNDDVYSALQGAPGSTQYTPPLPQGWPQGVNWYSYPALPLASWGGTFYFWNAPYEPTDLTPG